MQIDIIRRAELVETPWKNGTGIMRKIADTSVDGKNICQISIAEVSHDVPFSDYTGQERILTVIKGAGMSLECDTDILHAKPLSPVRFSGALKVHASLYDDASANFNIMFNPDECDGDVSIHRGPCQQLMLEPNARRMFAVHALEGSVTLSGNEQLASGDTALIHTNECTVALADGDSMLLVTVHINADGHATLSRA